MNTLLTIDPGIHMAGVAVWQSAELIGATLVRTEKDRGGWVELSKLVVEHMRSLYVPIDTIVIEKPQIYPQHKQKGNPNDLINLACAAGGIATALLAQHQQAEVFFVLPYEWKKQVPKSISSRRSEDALSEDERERVALPSAKGLAHNVWDAVGIGLYWVRNERRQCGGR